MTEKELLELIQSYAYNKARLIEIQDELNSVNYKITAMYGNLAPSSGGTFNSKVETIGNKRHELKARGYVYKNKIERIIKYIENSGLTDREKGVIYWLAKNRRLQAYARREHIGKDNIYKIRDRALKKIIIDNKLQNVKK